MTARFATGVWAVHKIATMLERRRTTFARAVAATLVAAAAFFTACGSSTKYNSSSSSNTTAAPAGSGTTVASAAATATDKISAKDFDFHPSTITVKAGTTVTWTNNDATQHQIADDNHAFQGDAISHGQTFTHAYTAAGTFGFHCAIHPSMTGSVTVTA